MATVTHYIYSHYDPNEKKESEERQETDHGDDSSDPWQTESAFGVRRRLAAAPQFVPAVISYEELNGMVGTSVHLPPESKPEGCSSEVSSWYRSLTRQNTSTPIPTPQPRPMTAPPVNPIPQRDQKISQHNDQWFITRALRSEPPTKPSTPQPTLADILSREPPSSSSKDAVKPPVFLALGPANKGWTMLQQQGWNEGEGLGATAPRKAPLASLQTLAKRKRAESGEGSKSAVKQEEREVQWDSDGEVQELRRVEVVDLTIDSDEESEVIASEPETEKPASSSMTTQEPPESHTTPLLTPIPTVLKSDRLGIGLKAKTVGPYKASKKRVTHNQAALAEHIRANEETRRMKALVGKGTKGFARLAKAESEHRRQLLASLNAD